MHHLRQENALGILVYPSNENPQGNHEGEEARKIEKPIRSKRLIVTQEISGDMPERMQ